MELFESADYESFPCPWCGFEDYSCVCTDRSERDEWLNTRFTVEEFLEMVASGGLVDYDGYGYAVIDDVVWPEYIVSPSTAREDIPSEATHVEWYNR